MSLYLMTDRIPIVCTKGAVLWEGKGTGEVDNNNNNPNPCQFISGCKQSLYRYAKLPFLISVLLHDDVVIMLSKLKMLSK